MISSFGKVTLSSAMGNKISLTEKGAPNGVVPLNSNGQIDIGFLDPSVIEYKGSWNALTNTPILSNGVGSIGNLYIVSVAGVQFGITFDVSDFVIYNGTQWEKIVGSWSVGPQGPIGLTGATGATGPQGPIGLTGATGAVSSIISTQDYLLGIQGTPANPILDPKVGAQTDFLFLVNNTDPTITPAQLVFNSTVTSSINNCAIGFLPVNRTKEFNGRHFKNQIDNLRLHMPFSMFVYDKDDDTQYCYFTITSYLSETFDHYFFNLTPGTTTITNWTDKYYYVKFQPLPTFGVTSGNPNLLTIGGTTSQPSITPLVGAKCPLLYQALLLAFGSGADKLGFSPGGATATITQINLGLQPFNRSLDHEYVNMYLANIANNLPATVIIQSPNNPALYATFTLTSLISSNTISYQFNAVNVPAKTTITDLLSSSNYLVDAFVTPTTTTVTTPNLILTGTRATPNIELNSTLLNMVDVETQMLLAQNVKITGTTNALLVDNLDAQVNITGARAIVSGGGIHKPSLSHSQITTVSLSAKNLKYPTSVVENSYGSISIDYPTQTNAWQVLTVIKPNVNTSLYNERTGKGKFFAIMPTGSGIIDMSKMFISFATEVSYAQIELLFTNASQVRTMWVGNGTGARCCSCQMIINQSFMHYNGATNPTQVVRTGYNTDTVRAGGDVMLIYVDPLTNQVYQEWWSSINNYATFYSRGVSTFPTLNNMSNLMTDNIVPSFAQMDRGNQTGAVGTNTGVGPCTMKILTQRECNALGINIPGYECMFY